MKRLTTSLIVPLAVMASAATAQDKSDPLPTSVVLMTIPEESEWIADGTTPYRLDVYVDATQEALPVGAFQWVLSFQDSLSLVSDQWPTQDFFFQGYTVDTALSDPAYESTSTSASGRLLIFEWPGPIASQGNIATYYLTVDPATPAGQYHFDLDTVVIGLDDPTFSLCEPALGVCDGLPDSIINVPFTIVPPTCIGDLDADNDTDVLDFGIFAGNFGSSGHPPNTNGDLDGDGDVDVLDFGIFAGDFGCAATISLTQTTHSEP